MGFLQQLTLLAAIASVSVGSAAASLKIVPKTPSEKSTPKDPAKAAPQDPTPVPSVEEGRLPPAPSAEEVDLALARLLASNLPNLPLKAYRFDETLRRGCNEQRGRETMVRALLVASAETSDTSTTAHDIELIVSALKTRGVPETAITVLDGSKLKTQLDRAKLIEGFNSVLSCIQAGDQLIIHFSGFSVHVLGWTQSDKFQYFINRDTLIAEFCKLQKQRCNEWAKEKAVEAVFHERLERIPSAVLAVSNAAAASGQEKELTGLWNFELANFITQVRNRGADVFAFLDTSYAATYRLGDLQTIARQDRRWQARGSHSSADLIERPISSDQLVPLERDAGAFAAFYASGTEGEAYVIKSGDKQVGAFSLALSHTLQTELTPDVATLALGIVRALGSGDSTNKKYGDEPEFEASSSGLAVLAPRKPLEANSDDIEIIEPAATRGGGAFVLQEDGPVRVIARFKRPSDAEYTMIRDQVVPMERDGTFSAEVPAVELYESINVSVLTRQRQFVTHKISIAPSAALPQALAQVGRRFALLIGNENYKDNAFKRLSTPRLDVKAVAETLTKNFGFVTSLPTQDGKEISLILLDASADQIYDTLDALNRELGSGDQLLVYYAGHGIFEEATNTAYWVPVDAHPGYYRNFLPATEITRALQRIKARNILIVSDSCYAGAMVRSGEQGLTITAAERMQALTKLTRQKNRMLLTSGGNEPVLDQGGKGHSIFARAFIDGLQNMDFDVFSSQELYTRILPVVSGRAKQEPKHNFLRESGHEGGDFVFVRTRSPKANTAQE